MSFLPPNDVYELLFLCASSSSHLLAFHSMLKIKSLQLILPLYAMSQFPSLLPSRICVCISHTMYTQFIILPEISPTRLSRHYKVNNLINSCSIISTQKLFTICIIILAHIILNAWHDIREEMIVMMMPIVLSGLKSSCTLTLTTYTNLKLRLLAHISAIERDCVWSSWNNWVI